MNRDLATDIVLFLTAAVWALNFSIVKISLEEIPPMAFNAIRFMLASLFIWIVVLRRGEQIRVRHKDWLILVFLGLLGNLVYQVLFILGIDITFSANAAVMLGTIPVWVAIFSRLMGLEQLPVSKIFGVVFAFAGVFTIMAGSGEGFSSESQSIWGDLLILASAAVFGYYTVRSKEMLGTYTPIEFTAISMTVGTIALFFAGLPDLIAMDFQTVSPKAWGGAMYSGFLSIGVAYLAWNYGIRNVGAVRTSTFQNLVPVMGLAFGYIILGEKLSILQYLGCLFVIVGIILARKQVKIVA